MSIETAIFGALRESESDTYFATVLVSTFMGSESEKSIVDHTQSINVTFKIFVEKAKYGIAGITAGDIQDFTYVVQVEDDDGNVSDLEVSVPGSELSIEYVGGSSVTLDGIEIRIDEDGKFMNGEATFTNGAAR